MRERNEKEKEEKFKNEIRYREQKEKERRTDNEKWETIQYFSSFYIITVQTNQTLHTPIHRVYTTSGREYKPQVEYNYTLLSRVHTPPCCRHSFDLSPSLLTMMQRSPVPDMVPGVTSPSGTTPHTPQHNTTPSFTAHNIPLSLLRFIHTLNLFLH